jgi:hypothetical protein
MVYQKPVDTKLVVRSVGEVKITPKGNSFLECKTSVGTVAFWGDSRGMSNINKIGSRSTPFALVCGCIDSNWPEHAFWVPQSAQVVIDE